MAHKLHAVEHPDQASDNWRPFTAHFSVELAARTPYEARSSVNTIANRILDQPEVNAVSGTVPEEGELDEP